MPAITGFTYCNLAGEDAGPHLQCVKSEPARDGVLTIAGVEDESVIAPATVQNIVAFSASKGVVSVVAGQRVLPGGSDKRVISIGARDLCHF